MESLNGQPFVENRNGNSVFALQPAIVQQPKFSQSSNIVNCPPGLEYLTAVDQLLVKQQIETLEILTGIETNNRYTICNSVGQTVYWAKEDTDCCTRNIFGHARPFEINISDAQRRTVIHLDHQLACSYCCCQLCLQTINVSAPPGNAIGSVQADRSMCGNQSFAVRNVVGDTVLRIVGPPICSCSCCGDVEFKVTTLDGSQIGQITKQWSGLLREMFTDADYFGIVFPMDLDVNMKAVLLGACFLIDMLFFEKSN